MYYICFNCVLFEQCWFYNNARQFIICIYFQCACTYFRVLNFTLRKNDFDDDIHQLNRFSFIYIFYVIFNNKCLFSLSLHKSLIALDKIVQYAIYINSQYNIIIIYNIYNPLLIYLYIASLNIYNMPLWYVFKYCNQFLSISQQNSVKVVCSNVPRGMNW